MSGLLFSRGGSLTYERTHSLKLAAVAGVWCAGVGTIITCLFGFGYNFVQMAHLVEFMRADIALSGMTDQHAYVIRNTIDSASTHFLLAPFLGVISGCGGGFVSSQLRGRPRQLAILLGAVSIGVLTFAVALIHFGLNLPRADRVPYISGSMIGSALALVCLWPVTRCLSAPRMCR